MTRRDLLLALAAAPAGAAWSMVRVPALSLLKSEGEARALPGSTVKPLVAMALDPNATFRCARTLQSGGRTLDCTHPPLGRVSLSDAICHSCNSYFAQAAARTSAARLRNALASFGLEAQLPRNEVEQVWLALGLWGVQVSPAELARAYGRFSTSAPRLIREGVERAAMEGTAQLAQPVGVTFAGKTGTVPPHAWCAGWAPRDRPAIALAVFVPSGQGSTEAAPAAREILNRWASERLL